MHRRALATATALTSPEGAVLRRRVWSALLLALLSFAPGPTQAGFIEYAASYALTYYPPNPCSGTPLGGYSLEGSTLQGVLSLFARDSRAGLPVAQTSLDVGPVACGQGLQGALRLFLDADALPAGLWAAFGGAIAFPDPAPSELPLFAFPDGTGTPVDAPSDVPEIAIALLDGGGSMVAPSPDLRELPLFAFASPGTAVGTLRIGVSRVPEPPLLLLTAAGLAALGFSRRQPRRLRPGGQHDLVEAPSRGLDLGSG